MACDVIINGKNIEKYHPRCKNKFLWLNGKIYSFHYSILKCQRACTVQTLDAFICIIIIFTSNEVFNVILAWWQ